MRLVALSVSVCLWGCGPAPQPEPLAFVAMTFNTGTTSGLPHDALPEDGYGPAEAALSDAWYGDGLAFNPVVEDTRVFLAGAKPAVVGFQELFYSGECPGVPPEARAGFVCETWQPGDPTVAQVILGPDYQVACHPGKPDKCLAVLKAFGRFQGCDSDLCLEGLTGSTVDGCGRGARVGRGVIELARGGGTVTVVNVHGSSGLTKEDMACREQQFRQVFEDAGDGAPAASGEHVVVLGDFNTDPARFTGFDTSAALLKRYGGRGARFHFVSDARESAKGTYGGLFNIDHVLSDTLSGHCWIPTVTPGRPAVTPGVFFDHLPHACTLVAR